MSGFNHSKNRGSLKDIKERFENVGYDEDFQKYFDYENKIKQLYNLASSTNDTNLMKSLGFVENPFPGQVNNLTVFKLKEKISSLSNNKAEINFLKLKFSNAFEEIYSDLKSPKMKSINDSEIFRRSF